MELVCDVVVSGGVLHVIIRLCTDLDVTTMSLVR